jgi:hypothetical protein
MMKLIPFVAIAGAFALATAHAQEIGKPAPDFTAKNTKGEEVALSTLKGKIVVLEWANFDCPFSKKHYTSGNLPKLQESYAGKDVVWLTVNSSAEGKQGYLDPSKAQEVVSEKGNKATHYLLDPAGELGKAYDAKVTPHLFIIDAKGTLVYNGAIDSLGTTEVADIEKADKLFVKALDAVIAGQPVENAKNQPYGCTVKY